MSEIYNLHTEFCIKCGHAFEGIREESDDVCQCQFEAESPLFFEKSNKDWKRSNLKWLLTQLS